MKNLCVKHSEEEAKGKINFHFTYSLGPASEAQQGGGEREREVEGGRRRGRRGRGRVEGHGAFYSLFNAKTSFLLKPLPYPFFEKTNLPLGLRRSERKKKSENPNGNTNFREKKLAGEWKTFFGERYFAFSSPQCFNAYNLLCQALLVSRDYREQGTTKEQGTKEQGTRESKVLKSKVLLSIRY